MGDSFDRGEQLGVALPRGPRVQVFRGMTDS
jgi:hypothetical protein